MEREFVAHLDPANAVAMAVQQGRVNPDAELPGQHGDDPARHPAFRRHAHAVDPLAGVVIHAAGPHHAEHALDIFPADGPPAGHRVGPGIGQRRGHDSEVMAINRDRALSEIQLEHRIGIVLENAEIAEQVADRAVAVPGHAFRAIYFLVHRERPSSVGLEHGENALELVLARSALHQPGAGDGPGVDHRIDRTPRLRMQADRIEGLPARLHPDFGQHLGSRVVLEREPVNERLGDRLNGEKLTRLADLVDLAVDRRHRDAEVGRVGFGQLRDVVRQLPRMVVLEERVDLFQSFFDR